VPGAVTRLDRLPRQTQAVVPAAPFGVEHAATEHREPLLGVQRGERVEAQPQPVGTVAAELPGVQAALAGEGLPVEAARRIARAVAAQPHEVVGADPRLPCSAPP